jgi:hypothetical protein
MIHLQLKVAVSPGNGCAALAPAIHLAINLMVSLGRVEGKGRP